MTNGLQIGVVARVVGRSNETLRAWEKLGLIQPARTKANIRLYSADDLEKLSKIAKKRRPGRPSR